MRTSEENIRQLLEMLDNPDAYTEQEIQDIINRDEDTRETYRLMVEAKRSSRHCQHQKPVNADAAWQKFLENEELRMKSEEGLARRPEGESQFATARPTAQHHSSFFTFHSSFQKIAASFIGVLLVSGIAFAAIWKLTPGPSPKEREVYSSPAEDSTNKSNRSPLFGRGAGGEAPSVIYDNIPLEKMLPEIASHYNVEVTFANDEVRGLRFRFVWNPQQGIDQVISDLNQFEHLTVTRKDNQITVDGLLSPSEK